MTEQIRKKVAQKAKSYEVGKKVWDFSGYNKNPRLAEILKVLPDGDRVVLKLKDEKGETVTSSENVLKEEEYVPGN